MLCTFVPHFLAPLFLGEQRSPKAMLQLIVPVLVQQDLLLECKPLVDWLKIAVVQENETYILGANPDPFLLAVDKVLMDHRMILHKSNLPGCWATPPPTQAIANTTGSDVLIAEELGDMRRAHEEVLADKKRPPKSSGGWSRSTKFCAYLGSTLSLSFPPCTALAVGTGVAQDQIILQNAFVACCLEAGAGATTAHIVTPTFA